jgi:hypothetical protein
MDGTFVARKIRFHIGLFCPKKLFGVSPPKSGSPLSIVASSLIGPRLLKIYSIRMCARNLEDAHGWVWYEVGSELQREDGGLGTR